jgi:hypothetical protein
MVGASDGPFGSFKTRLARERQESGLIIVGEREIGRERGGKAKLWVVESAGIESERGIRETGIECASYRISAAASAGVDLLPRPLLAIEVSIKLVSPPAGD